jgi:hypothetical protein
VDLNNDLEYIYDGTFEGFLCCVYASLTRREIPRHIYVETGLPLLGETATWISTDWEQAQRVYVSLSKRIGIEAQDIVKEAFLTHMYDREMRLYRYIILGYKIGRLVISTEDWIDDVKWADNSSIKRSPAGRNVSYMPDMRQRELILQVLDAVQKYRAEVKNVEGSMRFRSYVDVMVSCITPHNRVLPSLAEYFEKRFRNSNFLVYDKTHQMAAVHRQEGTMVTHLKDIDLPVLYDEKNVYEKLWRSWYDQLHIELPNRSHYALNEMKSRLWCEISKTG